MNLITIIISPIITVISAVVSIIYNIVGTFFSFMRGPLLVGAIIGIALLSFDGVAHAAVIQCNHAGCPPLSGYSVSQMFGITLTICGVVIALMLHKHRVK